MIDLNLRNVLFNNTNVVIYLDGVVLHSYVINPDELILQFVETTNFNRGEQLYYEYVISNEQWENGVIKDNTVTIDYEVGGPIILQFFNLAPAKL